MKIRLRVDGGFAVVPGLARPFCIDVDALPPDEAAALRAALEEAGFFERPEPPSVARTPDARRFVVTAEDDGRCRTLTFGDDGCDAGVDALLRLLRERQRAARRT